MKKPTIRIAKTMKTETVLRILAEEMALWGQRSERGALGVVLARLLEAHQSEKGARLDHPFAQFIQPKKRARKRRT